MIPVRLPPAPSLKKKRRRRDIEGPYQKALIDWAKTHPICRRFLFAIPNGGYRNKSEAARLRDQGVRAGVSDLFLPYPVYPYSGLWIEMKPPKNYESKVTSEQAAWLELMRASGYEGAVCYGDKEAQKLIENYLSRKSEITFSQID